MPRTISKDRSSPWEIDGDSKIWTLKEQATITVDNAAAVDVPATSVGNTLKLFGDIIATGEDGEGVRVAGDDTKLLIGPQSSIDADEGVHNTSDGLRVTNKGEIDGLHYGVSSSTAANIRNFGDIRADVGISTLGTSRVVNGADGMIQGDNAGVIMAFGSDATLINHGMISGNSHAVSMITGGDNRLVNTGTIHGDIDFGIGDDLFDSSKGKMVGDIAGGDGNDVFRLGRNTVEIIELDGDGTDSVFATRKHVLADNVETLTLLGARDIDGVGNDGDNTISGNDGGNRIDGKAGNDLLGGGKGEDFLTGGDGEDIFIFAAGDGHDVINDFIKGDDLIWMPGGFDSVGSFEDLQPHMFKNGSDVWIQLGHGDRLIVKGVDVEDLDASDFSFSPF